MVTLTRSLQEQFPQSRCKLINRLNKGQIARFLLRVKNNVDPRAMLPQQVSVASRRVCRRFAQNKFARCDPARLVQRALSRSGTDLVRAQVIGARSSNSGQHCARHSCELRLKNARSIVAECPFFHFCSCVTSLPVGYVRNLRKMYLQYMGVWLGCRNQLFRAPQPHLFPT